ncbi:hypothetical protein [Zavarzinia compransoris]|uniref:hypothetical protein n=1 Tax=Zavarzinia compransoris TaxID=1264899 RepID=UPI00105FD004|nr:hypothetical protein [Zavarzinia compransoris]
MNAAKLPKSFGVTLRVLWILTSPEYDFGDISPSKFAGLATKIVFGAKNLAANEFKADHLKIHLGGLGDREFFNGVASTLENLSQAGSAKIAGNWLQIERLTRHQAIEF